MTKAYDCTHQGHLWLEDVTGIPFVRHRGRKGVVAVHCQFCTARAQIESHGAYTAPPTPHDVDHAIPAPFKKVLDRAMADAKKNDKKDNTGSGVKL